MKKSFFTGRVLLGAALVAGMLLSGCGNSENFVFTNTVLPAPVIPPLPAPPLAVNDAFNALGNATVTYTAANGVLTNDTVNGAQISEFDAIGSQGGTVALNADGSFSYSPVFGFVGAETFNYTLSNADGDSTATVTMTSTGEGWFVNNTAGNTGDGSQADPFDTLAEAVAASGAGDTVFVARGDGSSTGLSTNITLPQGVSLIGEGQGLILGQTIVPQGLAPVIDATVTVSGDNTISGLIFEGIDDAINGDGFTNVTVTNNTFRDGSNSGEQIDLDNMLGTITISDNAFLQDNDTESTNLNTQGVCTVIVNNNTFDSVTPTADGEDCVQVFVFDGGNATIQVNDNVCTGAPGAGDSLERGIVLAMTGASQATLTVTGNEISQMQGNSMAITLVDTADLTANFSGNVINLGKGFPDLVCSANDDTNATITLDNNNISNPNAAGCFFTGNDLASLSFALRNNVITSVTPNAVNFEANGSSSFCCEITDNDFGGNLDFNDASTSTIDVEQFGDPMGDVLATLNDFLSGGITVTGQPVNSVSDGDCMIP